jgi:hypothetical protein
VTAVGRPPHRLGLTLNTHHHAVISVCHCRQREVVSGLQEVLGALDAAGDDVLVRRQPGGVGAARLAAVLAVHVAGDVVRVRES